MKIINFRIGFIFVITDEQDKNKDKEVKYSSSSDHQDLLNSEDLDSTDSSDEYALYSNSRKR